jgi:hypothetical protein
MLPAAIGAVITGGITLGFLVYIIVRNKKPGRVPASPEGWGSNCTYTACTRCGATKTERMKTQQHGMICINSNLCELTQAYEELIGDVKSA